MKTTICRILLPISILTAFAHAAWKPEFNWTPCGVINVGDRNSEAASQYESEGRLRVFQCGYRDGPINNVTGRWVTGSESFVVRPASWRGGPALAPLVIVKCVDSTDGPVTLRVEVGETDAGTWRIEPRPGPRHLYDAFFAVPTSVWLSAVSSPREVPVTITGDKPSCSLGYRFFSTRWVPEGDHGWTNALAHFPRTASSTDYDMARLARVDARRAKLRSARSAVRNDKTRDTFDTHYKLGLYAAACECWPDALEEFQRAVELDASHADATYRLAEAMEYNRMPVEQFAPVYERAGLLGEGPGCNEVDVLAAIHSHAISGMCHTLTRESIEAIKRDWHYVEQMVYGASLGAYKMRTHYYVARPGDSEWVMHAGWIFLPPEESVPVQGTYDYSIGFAEYSCSHAGGVDCGVSGSGGAQIGARRGWEVFFHEWNHEFDWTCLFSEVAPNYPTTHDSDGCGKKPIVNMGCGHRSSMRYYITPAQYRRQEPSDPVASEACVDEWALGPVVSATTPPDMEPQQLEAWLIEKGHMSSNDVARAREEHKREKETEERMKDNPPSVRVFPPRTPVPAWPEYLHAKWHRVKMLDSLSDPREQPIAAGAPVDVTWRPLHATNDFVDLLAAAPHAPEKCVAYARTFIYSPCRQEVRLWLGFNDTAAFWLNGRKIYKGRYYACAKWEDANRPYMLATSGVLEPGWNVLSAKVERGGGDWGFSVHIVDVNNHPVNGLRFATALPQGEILARYVPPAVGPRYRWEDVKDDYLELLPRLAAGDLDALTGLDGLTLSNHVFFVALPKGRKPLLGSRYIAAPDETDREFNNFLNWDYEHAAALRFARDGKTRDLLIVRPEYFTEFLTLLKPRAGMKPADESVVGYLFITECHYSTTPNYTGRVVIVIDTCLEDYPLDDLDLLSVQ